MSDSSSGGRVRLQVWIRLEEMNTLGDLAREQGVTIADLVRGVLRDWLLRG